MVVVVFFAVAGDVGDVVFDVDVAVGVGVAVCVVCVCVVSDVVDGDVAVAVDFGCLLMTVVVEDDNCCC